MPRIVYEGPDGTQEHEGEAGSIAYERERDCWRIALSDGQIRFVPASRVYYFEKEEAETVDIGDVDA